MITTFLYGVLLFVFWLSLSGHVDPLLIGLGVMSVILTLFLIKRMDILDQESFPIQIFTRLPRFFVYIFWEVLKSNIDVLKRILTWGDLPISRNYRTYPLPQESDLGRVIYANAITLTPGTVSVELGKDSIIVHALTREAAEDLATGAMADAVPDVVVKS